MTYPPFLLQTDPVSPEALPLLLVLTGLGLSLAEAITPGTHFVVLGMALFVVGLTGLLIVPLASPIILGLLVLVFGALAFCGYQELDVYGGRRKGKTSDPDALTGKMGHVAERITSTDGEIKLGEGDFNPCYAIRSVHGELEMGAKVIVVDPGSGNAVVVEGVSPGEGRVDRELAHERVRRREESAEWDKEELEREGTEGV